MSKLQSFRYEGDHKNFNFDKYVNLHVEQHNQHADLRTGLHLLLRTSRPFGSRRESGTPLSML